MNFRARECEWCGSPFKPNASRQRRCDECRAAKPAASGRCNGCGAPVSGRSRWSRWGGECDRAEQRVDELERLLASAGREAA